MTKFGGVPDGQLACGLGDHCLVSQAELGAAWVPGAKLLTSYPRSWATSSLVKRPATEKGGFLERRLVDVLLKLLCSVANIVATFAKG